LFFGFKLSIKDIRRDIAFGRANGCGDGVRVMANNHAINLTERGKGGETRRRRRRRKEEEKKSEGEGRERREMTTERKQIEREKNTHTHTNQKSTTKQTNKRRKKDLSHNYLSSTNSSIVNFR
jgi:hypothetical protein